MCNVTFRLKYLMLPIESVVRRVIAIEVELSQNYFNVYVNQYRIKRGAVALGWRRDQTF